jgi:hypothetical protein
MPYVAVHATDTECRLRPDEHPRERSLALLAGFCAEHADEINDLAGPSK